MTSSLTPRRQLPFAAEELAPAISAYVLAASCGRCTASASSRAAATPAAAGRPADVAANGAEKSVARESVQAKAAAPAGLAGKMRVLCLHGYVQNGDVFRLKTGSVRKAMKGCEFEFITAPLSAVGAFPDNEAADFDAGGAVESGLGPRGWWHAGENARRKPDEPWVRPALATVCDGWEESMEHARREVAAKGPFDGVFAFSQGCAIATALLREVAEGSEVLSKGLGGVRFAIMVGGFLPRDTAKAQAMRGRGVPLKIASLHVTGTQDNFVPRPRSEELAELFDPTSADWLEHAGRHGVPTGSGATKDAVKKIISDVSGS